MTAVVSIGTWQARPLRAGDEGVVDGPAPPPCELQVNFGGGLVGFMRFAEVALPSKYHASLRGFTPGGRVRSLRRAVLPPCLATGWAILEIRPGDEGTFEGMSQEMAPGDIHVVFQARRMGEAGGAGGAGGGEAAVTVTTLLPMMFSDICLTEEYPRHRVTAEARAATEEEQSLLRLDGQFAPGDRVRSLVSGDHWQPRSMRVGDEGTVQGAVPFDDPHHQVRSGGVGRGREFGGNGAGRAEPFTTSALMNPADPSCYGYMGGEVG